MLDPINHAKSDNVGSDEIKKAAIHDINNMLGAVETSLMFIDTRLGDDVLAKRMIANSLESLTNSRHFIHDLIASKPDLLTKRKGFDPIQTNINNHAQIDDTDDHHNLFFAAIEMTRMPMVVTDPNQPDNPIIFSNQAFLQTTGHTMDEVIGQNCRFLQGTDTDPETTANIRQAIKDRTDIAVEIQNYRKDGTMFWNALFISPIFDRNGKLLYFFGSQLDVTRRREAENSLRRAQKMEAVGQLTGGIAHDFNNLLQVIIGHVQMGQTVADQPTKLSKHLSSIAHAAESARALTQQLLAFSRKQPLEARVTNLNRVIAELKEILSKTLGAKIDIQTELADNLANSRIDIVQLELALINILVNARDAMPGGGVVTIKTANMVMDDANEHGLPAGPYAMVSVTDTGIGIPAELLGKVTEPFFTTKDVGKGTGLGLAQVYGFAKQSNGTFLIESQVGVGTTIALLFPTVTTALEVNEKAAGMVPQTRGRGEHILIVEDNEQVRELACAILENEGYKVSQASHARAALDMIEREPFDMLFTDIVMPGAMNGVTLAKLVKKKYQQTRILITTGFAEDVHGHTNASEFEIVYKPYVPDELTQKVRNILNRKNDHGN